MRTCKMRRRARPSCFPSSASPLALLGTTTAALLLCVAISSPPPPLLTLRKVSVSQNQHSQPRRQHSLLSGLRLQPSQFSPPHHHRTGQSLCTTTTTRGRSTGLVRREPISFRVMREVEDDEADGPDATEEEVGSWRLMAIEDLLQSTHSTVEMQGKLLFNVLQAEAKEAVKSPLIGKWVDETILSARDLPDAMGRILLGHMRSSPALFDMEAARQMVEEICSNSLAVRVGVITDLTKAVEADLAVESILQPFLNFKGLHAITLARISRVLWKREGVHNKHAALALQSHGSMQYGIDIHPTAQIGDGVFVDHATGLVIGATAEVGDNVMLLHGVTLGATGKRVEGKRHPTVGAGSVVGALATVLGDVMIGSEATVGAQAVVTKDVCDGETVVGINKILDGATKRERMLNGGDENTWFYNI